MICSVLKHGNESFVLSILFHVGGISKFKGIFDDIYRNDFLFTTKRIDLMYLCLKKITCCMKDIIYNEEEKRHSLKQ